MKQQPLDSSYTHIQPAAVNHSSIVFASLASCSSGLGPRLGCMLSPLQFVMLLLRIWRCIQDIESFWLDGAIGEVHNLKPFCLYWTNLQLTIYILPK